MNENIGVIACVVCNEPTPVREQKNGKAMLNCQWCGFQGYARGAHCDSLLRARMTPTAKPEPAPAPAVDDKPEPKAPKSRPALFEGL